METLNKKINARLLYRKLTALAINPEEIKVKKYSENGSDYHNVYKKDTSIDNCYNTCCNVLLILLNNDSFVIPTDIFTEYELLTAGLKLKENLKVPLADTLYQFENADIKKKWQFLLELQEKLIASW